ncbi:MAG: FAD-binding oxidoreductase [Nanoarchaeota archaeon]|nr:FAD-binding oxidoreductase [Nanoarchaeota archaeon]
MQQTQQIQEYILKISKIIDETPQVKAFRLEQPSDANINFYPGQFFMVSLIDDPEIKTSRAYSIASSPLSKGYLEIAFDKVGPFTTKLFAMKEDDLLKFKGPYGKFYFNEEMKNNLVLIAGGTGITPLMSIMRFCNDKKLSNRVKFIYSVKTPHDLIYKEELEKIKNQNNNFDYVVTVTRPNSEHNWKGITGRIDLDLLKQNIEDIEKSLYFLCGPKEFVYNIIEMLESLGVKKEQIKTDVWG